MTSHVRLPRTYFRPIRESPVHDGTSRRNWVEMGRFTTREGRGGTFATTALVGRQPFRSEGQTRFRTTPAAQLAAETSACPYEHLLPEQFA